MSPRLTLPFLILGTAAALAGADPTPDTANQTPVVMSPVIVSTSLDTAREDIVPSLGASTFKISSAQIDAQALGANAGFSQIVLQAPGVAQDSAANGDLHVRGEHGNLQYRINDVLLPEGISGFGLELDPRFVDTMQLVTGSLPAQYGFRTSGVIDIHTKSGALAHGAELNVFGGSYDTLKAGFASSGTANNTGCFIDGSFNHNGIGIENPTARARPIHDATDQQKTFVYLSHLLDATSRLSFMGSVSQSNFQVPNAPGLGPGTAPDGDPWLPGTFASARLNERQDEQNHFGILAYQRSTPTLNFQVAGYGRYSSVHFRPDPVGDLFFNGVASDVARRIASTGAQADASAIVGATHTFRWGAMALAERLTTNTTTTVFPVDAHGNPTGAPFSIGDNGHQHALFAGAYAQDEWKLTAPLTLNYGVRFDAYTASFDHEHQVSPRVNLIYRPTNETTLHAGYARYFTPPPLENVSASTVARFAGTSNAAALTRDDPVRSERAHYFDAGLSHAFSPRWQAGVDAYDKTARDQLDDGLFGQSLILSAFNYRLGRVYGVEFTTSYTAGGFSAYANLARSIAQGKDWTSAQFLFAPGDLTYVRSHWIYLDHDQQLSGSCGASYAWTLARGGAKAYLDLLYGSGLRTDATDRLGNPIPNGGTVPAYATVNLGAERRFDLGGRHRLKVRLDIVNLLDKTYELRNGTGVGVNAAQYGMRRGLFGSLSWSF